MRKAPGFTRSRRLGLAAAALLAPVALAAWLASGAGPERAATGGAGTAAPPPSRPVHRFVPGERRLATLEYASDSSSDFGAFLQAEGRPSGQTRTYSTRVRGRLVSTVVETGAGGVLIVLQIRQPSVRLWADGAVAGAQEARIAEGLGREAWATVSPEGRVLALRLDPSLDDTTRNFTRALLSVLQLVLPPAGAPPARRWEAEEDDPNGRYVAAYEEADGRADGAGRWAIRKTRSRYLEARPAAAGEIESPLTIEPGGEVTAVFGSGGGLLSLTGSQTEVFGIAGRTIARAETTFRLVAVEKQVLGGPDLAALRSRHETLARIAPAEPPGGSREADDELIERTELGTTTAEDLLAELATVEDGGVPALDETARYLKLKALIVLHPESCRALGEQLAKARPGATLEMLAGALSAVGSPEAQAALVAAIRARPADWPALSTLLPALGSVGSPTPAAEAALRELAFGAPQAEIATTAQLALGSLARSLANEPRRAAGIVDRAARELGAASSTEARRQWLLVLGNTGAVRALPAIEPCAADPRPVVRAAAATALRFVDSARADALLTRALADRDPAVRLEAAAAFGFRAPTPTTFAAWKSSFLSDPDAAVRVALLNGLWNARDAFPDAHELTRHAAGKDPAKDVRLAAAELLAQENSPPR